MKTAVNSEPYATLGFNHEKVYCLLESNLAQPFSVMKQYLVVIVGATLYVGLRVINCCAEMNKCGAVR